jgi:lipopolysaccharide biosynthesis regulator YciM
LVLLEQAPQYAGLVANQLQRNFEQAGQAEQLLQRLAAHYEAHPSLDLFDVLFRLTWSHHGQEAAWAFAQTALEAHPSLLGLERVLAAQLKQDPHPEGDPDSALASGPIPTALLKRLVSRHTPRFDRYSCRACGFQARAHYWQCPGCHGWETYSAKRLEEQI